MTASVLPFPDEAFTRREAVSEAMAASVRRHDTQGLADVSAAAACIGPVLEALGTEERWAEVLESLPERTHAFGIDELRNTLWNLGVRSTRQELTPDPGAENSFPYLVDAGGGNFVVVIRREESGFRCFVSSAGRYETIVDEAPHGVVFALTDRRDTQNRAREAETAGSWLLRLCARFRPVVFEVGCTSLLINLIAVLPSLFVMMVYDQVIGAQYDGSLVYLLAGVVAALSAEFALRWVRVGALARVAARIDYLVSTETFKHIMRLPPVAVERASLWAQTNQLLQFDAIKDFISGPNIVLVAEVPFMAVYLITIFAIGGPLCLAPIGMLMAFLAIALVFRIWARGAATRVQHDARRNQMVFEMLFGLEDIRAVGAQSDWMRDIAQANAESMREKKQFARCNTVISAIGTAVAMSGGVATLAYGAHLVVEDAISVGAVIASMILLWRLAAPAQSLLLLAPRIDSMLASARQIDAMMRLAAEPRPSSGTHIHTSPKGGLSLRNVSFRYNQDDNPAISAVSLDVDPGDFVVVTGYTGAGKSTLLNLITRMYRPQAGSLYIDGVDMRQIDPVELRQLISYLAHEPRIFRGTVADNLRMNQPTASDAELVTAADEAGILDQILALPQRFDTKVDSHDSSGLSSSLRYGICLARTYLRSRPILLLDEPETYLAREADERLVRSLAARRGKQTIILVTHRPSHMKLATRVFVLDNGQLKTG